MAALKYWVWLTTLPGLTDSSKMLLMEHFSSPEDIYYADEEALWQVDGLKKEQAALLGSKSLAAADRILSDCARKDIFLVTMADAMYPDRLRNIYQPPLLLYGKGAMPLFDEEAAVAVVGTRSCTPYGIKCAEKLGYELTQQGGMVVSGMAKGVDGAAMRGALRFGGFTCGVLGGGVDVVYPAGNRTLFEDIAFHGCLISEYPPQTPALGSHFPVRNRIISALSLGVVVVEAPKRSGALITANRALEQGRDVFTVPGNVGTATCEGNIQLLREGAIVVEDGWDIMKEYVHLYPDLVSHQPKAIPMQLTPAQQKKAVQTGEKLPPRMKKPEKKAPPANVSDTKVIDKRENRAYIDVQEILDSLSPDEKAAVMQLTDGEKHIDQLIAASGIPAARITAALTLLQIKGYVREIPGKRFCLAEKE